MSDTFEVWDRVSIKFAVEGVKGRDGTVIDILANSLGNPIYRVSTPYGVIRCTPFELKRIGR